MIITPTILILTAAVWIGYEGYLILRDRANARGSTRGDRKTRLRNSICMAIALSAPWLMLLTPGLQFSAVESLPVVVCGAVLILAGYGLRWWAVATLGRFFRTTIETEPGQRVIQNGPYRLIRHPAYTGIIILFLGYGLVSQNWLALIITGFFPAYALVQRIRIEEETLAVELGQAYRDYQQHTKRLIPYLW